jgi:HSP20 family protein
MSFMDPFFGGFGLDPFFGTTSGFPGREFWRQPTTATARGVRGPSQQELLSAPVRGIDLPTDNWWRPRSDLFLDEDNNEIRVEIELPGISFENINLECDGNSLVVSSYKAHTRKEDRGLFYLTERHFGNFYRRLDLPSRVDADRVEAHIKDGVLKITLPILASSGRRTRIPVSSTTETKRIEVPSAGGEGPMMGGTTEFTPGAVPPATFGQASEGATGISKEEASRGTTGKTGTEGVTAITGAVPSTVGGPEVQGAKKAGTSGSTSTSAEEVRKEQEGGAGLGGEKKSFRMD